MYCQSVTKFSVKMNVDQKATTVYLVHSYFIDFEYINQNKRVAYLYMLLIKYTDTYLCKYFSPKVIDVKEIHNVSFQDFAQQLPIPFEDEIVVEPNELNPSVLNRIDQLKCSGQKIQPDYKNYCTKFEVNKIDIKLMLKRGHYNRNSENDAQPVHEFIKSHIDVSYKSALKTYIHSNFMKSIYVKQDKIVNVPKQANFSFIIYGGESIVKYMFELESPYVVCTNNPKAEIILRQICLLPRFSYKSVYTKLLTNRHDDKDVSMFLIYRKGVTIIMSSTFEILDVCYSLSKLKHTLKQSKYNEVSSFKTNSSTLRRFFLGSFNVKKKMFFTKEQTAHFKRILIVAKSKYFCRKKFLIKKGVNMFQRNKIHSNKKVLYVHDFRNFCASAICRFVKDNNIKNIFIRLIRGKKEIPELKHVITTLFGMAKHHYPKLFYQTLNNMVYVTYKTFSSNKKDVFGMCKDSFFTRRKHLIQPVNGFRLGLEYKLRNCMVKSETAFIGMDDLKKETIIKGVELPPFAAAFKIISCIYRYISDNPESTHINIPYLIETSGSLTEADFNIHLKHQCKVTDFFYFGLNSETEFVYSVENLQNPIVNLQFAEPKMNVRPKHVCGEIDFKAYSNRILSSIVSFSRTFSLTHIINETVLYETDLFLKLFIQQTIFQKADKCHLPLFWLPECQL